MNVRDLAVACRRGLEADVTGSQSFMIAAADTVTPWLASIGYRGLAPRDRSE